MRGDAQRRVAWGVIVCFACTIAVGCSNGESSEPPRAGAVHPTATGATAAFSSSTAASVSSTSASTVDAILSPADVATDTAYAPAASIFGDATTTVAPQAPDDSYPPASACSVDARGMAARQTRSCRFTATESGGWWAGFAGTPLFGVNSFDPSAAVFVTRAGRQTLYETHGPMSPGMDMSWAGCDDNIIQPGDLVEVEITAGEGNNPGAYYEAGAGLGWNCSGHP